MSADFETSLLGLRFTGPETEQAYRHWRLLETLPLLRIGAWIGVATWLYGTYSVYVLAPEHYERIAWSIWVIAIPLITACTLLLTILPAHQFTSPALMIIALNTSGFAAFWQGAIATDYPGMGLMWALLTAMFAVFVRLAPGAAVVASAPYLLYAIYFTIECHAAGKLTDYEFHTYTSGPVMAIIFILVLCIFFERLLRQAYASSQQLERQNTSLQESRELIRRYVPPALAKQIESGRASDIGQPQRLRVTILFSDIVGFTDMADRVEAETLTEVINEYMAAMSEIVDAHQGTVNEFIGDGLMAMFGAPDQLEPEEQAHQAVLSAQAMQARLPELNQRWRKLGLGAALQIRIGINTGVVSVGSFGSEGRMTYTAIGLQTNIAARIQSHCEPGDILISDATYQLIADDIDCEAKGEVECKGVHFPVKAFSPMGHT